MQASMFTGGPVTSLSNDVFTEYLNNVRAGDSPPINSNNQDMVVEDAENVAYRKAAEID